MKKYLTFGNIFIALGLLIQCITFSIAGGSWISLISGCAGVVAVVLCSQRKYIQYGFSFLQLFTYCYLALQLNLYGELIENCFYFVTMIIGLFTWKTNCYDGIVESKSMNILQNVLVMLGTLLSTGCLFLFLSKTNDTMPLLDAISTMPAFVAQLLLIFRYKEQWIYWEIIDITSIIMWAIAGDWCMVVQYIFWTANCIYGYKMWAKQ